MHDHIAESDWKLFKKLYPLALERFYDRAVDEFRNIITEEEASAKDRYHEICKTVQNRDKKLAELFDGVYRRSAAFTQLVLYYREELVTEEELNQLSEENRARILSIVED